MNKLLHQWKPKNNCHFFFFFFFFFWGGGGGGGLLKSYDTSVLKRIFKCL